MLSGKTAVITGGSRGIGAAVVHKFASLGADIAVIYAGNTAAAEAVCEACRTRYGVKAKAYQCDVADFDAVKETTANIKADFGAVHILVNNAGITRDGLLAMMGDRRLKTLRDGGGKMLSGKTAVITGGSRGIGAAVVHKFASLGADIAVIYAGNTAAAEAVCEACRTRYDVKAKAYQCDVADFDAVKETTASIKADFGAVHILVNNAGITRDGLLAMMREKDFRGIGAAVVHKFASLGADIAVIYAGNTAAAEAVCEACRTRYDVKAKAYQCDVADFDAVKETTASIKADFGAVHILVNNAGITRDGLLAMMREKDFDDVVDTNLKGAFHIIRHLAGIFLRNREGCIIKISSVVGLSGNAGQCNYAASKAGLIGLTKSVAKELAAKGVRCNAIAPGFIETDMTHGTA